MSDPNPRGELVTCVRCKARATFTRDAVCAACRDTLAKRRGRMDQ